MTGTLPSFHHRPVSSRPLAGFVDLLWYWQGYALPAASERILPWGTVELVINLTSSSPEDSVISGPHSEAFLIKRVLQDELVGAHFGPGGAFPFLNIPYSDLHNRHVCITDVWGQPAAERLISNVREGKTVEDKLDRLQNWLAEVTARPLQHHPAVQSALRAFSSAPSAWSSGTIADSNNLSQRRFIQVFRDEVGLPPKLFCRIRRFHDVVAKISHHDEVDWSEIALTAGYYDQAHFIHDFREFCGLTPRQYLDVRIKDHLGHVHVP